MRDARRRRPGPTGFTLVELAVAATMLSLVLGVILRAASLSSEATEFAKRMGHLTMNGQTRLLLVREDVSASIRIFQNDTAGNGYWSALERPGLAPYAGAILPTIEVDGTLGKDTAANLRTGNVLLFAKAVLPFPTAEEQAAWEAWCDAHSCPEKKAPVADHRIDIYRLVAYYPRWPDGVARTGVDFGLDAVRWVSVPFADWDRVLEVDAADQAVVLEAMARPDLRGVRFLWRPGDPVESAFAEIQTDFALLPVTASSHPGWLVPRDPEWTEPSLLTMRRLSLATVWGPETYQVAKFALASTAGAGFPHGLEVQAVGPPSSRQVMVHLSLVAQAPPRGRQAWSSIQELIPCRDL